jgi:hypothetical protein
MCCHPGFGVPFIEHRKNRFCIILKGHNNYDYDDNSDPNNNNSE